MTRYGKSAYAITASRMDPEQEQDKMGTPSRLAVSWVTSAVDRPASAVAMEQL